MYAQASKRAFFLSLSPGDSEAQTEYMDSAEGSAWPMLRVVGCHWPLSQRCRGRSLHTQPSPVR